MKDTNSLFETSAEPLSHNCNLAGIAVLFIAPTSGIRPMNPAELFRQDSNTLRLAPRDFLIKEGEKGDKMYVLLDGEVDIFLGDFVFETAGPGALLGEMVLTLLARLTLSRRARRAWRKSTAAGFTFSSSKHRILRLM